MNFIDMTSRSGRRLRRLALLGRSVITLTAMGFACFAMAQSSSVFSRLADDFGNRGERDLSRYSRQSGGDSWLSRDRRDGERRDYRRDERTHDDSRRREERGGRSVEHDPIRVRGREPIDAKPSGDRWSGDRHRDEFHRDERRHESRSEDHRRDEHRDDRHGSRYRR